MVLCGLFLSASEENSLMEKSILRGKKELLSKKEVTLKDYQKTVASWSQFGAIRNCELAVVIPIWLLFFGALAFLLVEIMSRPATERYLEIYLMTYTTILAITLLISTIVLYSIARRRYMLFITKQTLFDTVFRAHSAQAIV